MHSAKDTQIIAQPSASAFTAVAMNLAHPIAIIIARPFTPPTARLPMSHSGVLKVESRLNFGIALPFVNIKYARLRSRGCFADLQAGRTISMMADEVAHQTALTPLDREDRRAICLISAVPAPFVGALPGRVAGVAVRSAFFPQRFGTVRRLPARRQAVAQSGEQPASCAEVAAAVGGRAVVLSLTRARGAPSVRLWSRRAAAGGVSRAVAASSQRSSRSVTCSSGRKLCSATTATSHSVGRSGARTTGSVGISARPSASVAPANADKLPRPAVRLSGSQS